MYSKLYHNNIGKCLDKNITIHKHKFSVQGYTPIYDEMPIFIKLKPINIVKVSNNYQSDRIWVYLDKYNILSQFDKILQKKYGTQYIPILINYHNSICIKVKYDDFPNVNVSTIIVYLTNIWNYKNNRGCLIELAGTHGKKKSITPIIDIIKNKCEFIDDEEPTIINDNNKEMCECCRQSFKNNHECDHVCGWLKHYEKKHKQSPHFRDWKYKYHAKYCSQCLCNLEYEIQEFEMGTDI